MGGVEGVGVSAKSGVDEFLGVGGVTVAVCAVVGDGRSRFEVSSSPGRFVFVVTGATLGGTWIFEDRKTVGKVVCLNPLATLLRSKGNGGPSTSVTFSFTSLGDEKGPRKPA